MPVLDIRTKKAGIQVTAVIAGQDFSSGDGIEKRSG